MLGSAALALRVTSQPTTTIWWLASVNLLTWQREMALTTRFGLNGSWNLKTKKASLSEQPFMIGKKRVLLRAERTQTTIGTLEEITSKASMLCPICLMLTKAT